MLSRTRSDPAVTAIAPTPTLGRCCCDLSPHCLCLGPCSVYEETRMLAPRLPRAGVLFAAKSAVAGPSSPSPLLRRPVAAAAPFQAPLGGPAQSRRSAATESQQSNSSSVVAQFATVDPVSLSGRRPHRIQNLLAGEWRDAKHTVDVLDPLNGEPFIQAPDTKVARTWRPDLMRQRDRETDREVERERETESQKETETEIERGRREEVDVGAERWWWDTESDTHADCAPGYAVSRYTRRRLSARGSGRRRGDRGAGIALPACLPA
eukprot:GHVU01163817.1.p1 GENE.GHVU01163817.1~~GHVU01163817.1.p1  ORF type:complete len:265 (-),score=26.20 GHVU01163817.1:304-1098(-)